MGNTTAAAHRAQGASIQNDGSCLFRIWAPAHEHVTLKLTAPEAREVQMNATERGYHEATVDGIDVGARYYYALGDGSERPDPASRSQPDGVHAASEVVSTKYSWTDEGWSNPPLDQYVLYELHVGTFSKEATFDGVIPHLSKLKDLGITAVELMPVSQFPGQRNWGYDGVYPFAAQASYGGLIGLQRFVDSAHSEGLAVVLDVVYNHLGPEGNYLGEFGPYFSSNYSTPWGHPINFDDRASDEVRRYFIDNALYWTEQCHIDALRLDAIHAIFDMSARPFLRQLADEVHKSAASRGRSVHLIAESALNDPAVVNSETGLAMDAHWNDDFHHGLHVALTGEQSGYYMDFNGLQDVASAINRGYVYTGQFSKFHDRSHGAEPSGVKPQHLVVFSQNHDQVGNRATGDRLSTQVGFEQLKLAAGVTLMSPFLPLIFMGEEYGEEAPFPYFISHTDPELVRAVQEGRKREFEGMLQDAAEVPDPQAESTFLSARLNHEMAEQGKNRALWELHKELLRLRREHPALQAPTFDSARADVIDERSVLLMWRNHGSSHLLAAFNFGKSAENIEIDAGNGRWALLMDSSLEKWGGESQRGSKFQLQRHSFQLLEKNVEEEA